MRVNVINPHTGRTVLRNAETVGTLLGDESGPFQSLTVVSHRTERFPVAVPTAWVTAYIPRTRIASPERDVNHNGQAI